MEFSFLELLAEQYANEKLPFTEYNKAESEENKEFYAKYITPTLEKDKSLGVKFEGDYIAVLCVEKFQSFQDGFKACIQMLLECAADKAVKQND